MPDIRASAVPVHGARADGSSWSKVIGPLTGAGLKVIAAPLPLTSLADDVAAAGREVERLGGPVVLAGHAYAAAPSRRTHRRQSRDPGAVQRPLDVACIGVPVERTRTARHRTWRGSRHHPRGRTCCRRC
jgi:hypothetical protein